MNQRTTILAIGTACILAGSVLAGIVRMIPTSNRISRLRTAYIALGVVFLGTVVEMIGVILILGR